MFSPSRPDRDERRRFGYLAARGSRAEYWLAFVAVTGIAMLFQGHGVGSASSGVMLVFTIRRLHDFNRSGWWTLLPLGLGIPLGVAMVADPSLLDTLMSLLIAGSVMFTGFVGFMPGDKETNRFGDPASWRKKRAELQETFS